MERSSVLDLEPGTRFNNYQLERLLGHGGMGAAFLTRDLALGRPVVVKVMLGDAASDPTLLERFRREAMAGALIDSENVVKVYEAGRIACAPSLPIHGAPFIAMQYVDGAPVSDVPKLLGYVEPERAAGLILGMARGLVATHAAGIVHRDVKPGNALLCRDGRVKLADFGLAKFLHGIGGGPPPPEITRPGTVVGTVAYIAPEQAKGDSVDGRADVFSLGCAFYEMLAGQLPWKGSTRMAMLLARMNADAKPVRAIDPRVPAAFDEACLVMLARDPARRPDSRGVVAMLERLVPGLRQEDLGSIFADPKAETSLMDVSSPAARYGLEKAASNDGFLEEVKQGPAHATTRTSPAHATSAAPARPAIDPDLVTTLPPPLFPHGPSVTAAMFFALGAFFLGAAAIAVALILRAPQAGPVSPSPATVSQPPAPPPPPAADPATPRTFRDAVATRDPAKVQAFLRSRPGAPESELRAMRDAERLLTDLRSQARGIDLTLPIDALLDGLADKRNPNDDLKAAAMLLAAVEGTRVPPELALPETPSTESVERLSRALAGLGLARPAMR